MRYYGNDDHEEDRVVELAQTLIDSADADVDFTQYHTIFIIHAGAGQETDIAGDSPEQIWSSFYDLGDIQTAVDDTVPGLETGDSLDGEPYFVDNFSVVPEDGSQDFATIATLGIWAFEAGSRLGLLPMFDATPPGFSDSQGAGNFCLMSHGLWIGPLQNDGTEWAGLVPSFPCSFNRLIGGWIDPVTIDTDVGTIALADLNSGSEADTVCVKIPITENEYYLVVNRVHDTNFDSLFTFGDNDSNLVPDNPDSLDGAEFDYYLTQLTNPTSFRYDDRYGFVVTLQHTGSGIYVWHIDENVIRQNLAAGHLLNDFVDRKGVDLEEADGVQDLDGPGYSGFAFGNHFDSFRAGDGNATTFGPSTQPNSASNSGARTGIVIENVSVIGSKMTFDISREIEYDEVRTRWNAWGGAQPPTSSDIDGDGTLEIVVLADTGLVYVFNGDGSEYDDADSDSTTIEPYIVVTDAVWAGPPALGNLDDEPDDDEIVATSRDGRLFAWKGDGTELTDGDNDAMTEGVLYAGRPMAAPPALIPSPGTGRQDEFDVIVVESANDSLHVSFINTVDGTRYFPGDPFDSLWPVSVRGQYAAPVALARTKIGETDGQTGVVLAWVDTARAWAGTSFTPAMWTEGTALVGEPPAQGWSYSWQYSRAIPGAERVLSAPAAGDIDADDYDEVVLTVPNGQLFVFDDGVGTNTPSATWLRAEKPSGPALGDVDLDGTLEIALWDQEFMYIKKHNGADLANWPISIVGASAGEQPPNEILRGLESPVVGDLDGDGQIETAYTLQDGTIHAFERDGAAVSGFPRVGPAGAKATPSVSALGSGAAGELSLVTVGFVESIGYFDTVVDTTHTTPTTTLSIQSLPGSDAGDRLYWPAFQAGGQRLGLVTEGVPLQSASGAVQTETFMIYPNPVPGSQVHARVTLNEAATVVVEIYDFEGERAFKQEYAGNPGGLINTPFDEIIDISRLKSGVYFLRLHISSGGSTDALVKPFAIRR
jgi:M6 family metalloprotease-like protein